MLEKRILSLLKLLENNIGDNYKIVDKQELLSMLPSAARFDITSLESALNYLSDRQYISIKYSDSNDICLCTTAKAKAYLEHSKSNIERTTLTKSQYFTIFAVVLIASFVGCLLATIVASLFN